MYYRNCIFLASDRVLQVTRLHEFKGACHLSELASPDEMVLISVKGRVNVDPCYFSRDPCVNDVKKTFLRDFCSPDEEDTLFLSDLEGEYF